MGAMGQIRDSAFDVVLAHHSLEHTPEPARELDEMHRVLRPGGRLLLFVPFERESRYRRFRRGEPNRHLFSWNAQTLANLVETHGFEVLSSECGPTGYERFAGETIARMGLGDLGLRILLGTLRFIRPVEEVRLVAKRP
jgi:SAM-dependent methyltransferase